MKTAKIYLGMLLWMSALSVTSQVSDGIRMVVQDRLTIDGGLATLDVQISNDGNTDFEGRLDLTLPEGLRSVTGTLLDIRVASGKKRFLSIKLQTTSLSSLKHDQIVLQLKNPTQNILSTRMVGIVVPARRSIAIQDMSDMQYLKQVGDSIHIRVQLTNNGTTDEDIRLLLASSQLEGSRDFHVLPLSLPGGMDTIIRIGFVVEKYMLELPQYLVRVSGLYENNDVFGHAMITFYNLTSQRNYAQMFHSDNSFSAYSRNYVDLQWNNVLQDQGLMYLRSAGEYRLGGGQLRYNLALSQISDGSDLPNLHNTLVEWEKNRTIYSIGNIQESLEAPVYGRGVKVAQYDSLSLNGWSVGLVERSSDLLGIYGSKNPGFTTYGKLVFGDGYDDRKRYEGQVYYDRNGIDSTESILWANHFDFLRSGLSEKIRIRGFVAGGVNRYLGGQLDEHPAEPSAALGLRLEGRTLVWSYNSDNYYSTAYYPGSRRGALYLSQGISRYIRQNSFALNYLFSNYAPQYLQPRLFGFDNQTSRISLRVQLPVSSLLNLQVEPSFNDERSDYMAWGTPTRLRLSNWRLQNTANFRSHDLKHMLALNVEAALSSVRTYVEENFALRGQLSYTYGALGLTGSYQKGTFQVYDVLNSYLIGRPFGHRTSLGATYYGALWQKKLRWNTQLNTTLTSDIGQSYAGLFNIQYTFRKHTILTAIYQQTYMTGSRGYNYGYDNLRIGIRQEFKGQNLEQPPVKTGDLRVFCFYDHNGNGVFDEDDEVAVGHHFTVRNILFMTDKRGEAFFKKMPYGEYMLFFYVFNGYQSLSVNVQILKRQNKIEVALQKVSKVSGRIKLDYDPGLNLEANPNLEGYRIYAQDKQGRLQQAMTDLEGHFEFSLPAGSYSFYLDEEKFSTNIYMENNLQEGQVVIGEVLQLEPFVLKVQSRKIEVKRFGKESN